MGQLLQQIFHKKHPRIVWKCTCSSKSHLEV